MRIDRGSYEQIYPGDVFGHHCILRGGIFTPKYRGFVYITKITL